MQVSKINFGNEQQQQNSKSVLAYAATGAVAGGVVGGLSGYIPKPDMGTDEFAKATLKTDANKLNEVAEALSKEGATLTDDQKAILKKFDLPEDVDAKAIKSQVAVLENNLEEFKMIQGGNDIKKLEALIEEKDGKTVLKGEVKAVLENADNKKLLGTVADDISADDLAAQIKAQKETLQNSFDEAVKGFETAHTDRVAGAKTAITDYIASIKDKTGDALDSIKKASNGLAEKVEVSMSNIRKGKMWKYGGVGAGIGAVVLGAYAYLTGSKEA